MIDLRGSPGITRMARNIIMVTPITVGIASISLRTRYGLIWVFSYQFLVVSYK